MSAGCNPAAARAVAQSVIRLVVEHDRAAVFALEDLEIGQQDVVRAPVVLQFGLVNRERRGADGAVSAFATFPGKAPSSNPLSMIADKMDHGAFRVVVHKPMTPRTAYAIPDPRIL